MPAAADPSSVDHGEDDEPVGVDPVAPGANRVAQVADASPAPNAPAPAESSPPAKPPTPRAPPPPTTDLVDSVRTSKSRAEISAWLVKPAEAAAAKRDWARAIPMYQALTVARGPTSAEARKLATLWTLAGQYDEARSVLEALVAATDNSQLVREARTEIDRLTRNADPFARQLDLEPVEDEAKKAFKQGRASFDKKKWGDALVFYTMGYALAPDLPGFLRELGATYDRLGEKDKKLDFYRRYLFRRPFGKNADLVRKELAVARGSLGKLTLASSLPCEEVWLNRQRVPGKLPKKSVLLAPGSYKGLCYNARYEIAFFQYADVTPSSAATLSFNWAILVNSLQNPLGRISIENPQSPGLMIDLGISNPEVGVVVPNDGHALRMILKDDLGTRQEERFVKLQPGQRQVIKW